MLVAYVSGHGFGHATRTGLVLRAVRERSPDLPLTVVTAAPESLFRAAVPGPFSFRRLECDVGLVLRAVRERSPDLLLTVVTAAPESLFRAAVPGPFTFRRLECDVGLVQKDALLIDEAETARRFADFASRWDEKVDGEVAFVRGSGARVVLGDIPPLAFAAAHAAGVPGVGLANFSWDWIYAHAARRAPELQAAAEHCARAYAQATLLLRLPFAGDLGAFPRIEDIPLVARSPAVPKEDARRRLDLDGRPAVLLSFGGIGLPGFRPEVLAPLRDFQLLVPESGAELPANVQAVGGPRLAALGLGYEDVVGASDVVVTKPGYGIVTDAIGARTRLVYTDRGDFPEYPILVEGMKAYLPTAYATNDEVREGRLAAVLGRVLAAPFPPPPDLSGAARGAERLLALVSSRG